MISNCHVSITIILDHQILFQQQSINSSSQLIVLTFILESIVNFPIPIFRLFLRVIEKIIPTIVGNNKTRRKHGTPQSYIVLLDFDRAKLYYQCDQIGTIFSFSEFTLYVL